MPACYLLAYHATRKGIVSWCRGFGGQVMDGAVERVESLTGWTKQPDHDVIQWSLKMSFTLACWAQLFILTLTCGKWPKWPSLEPFTYQYGYQAVFVEGADHIISWQYMTHPSLLAFVALWIGEVVLLILPGLCVALGSIYLPWHFKRMGTACFGIYVIHVPLAYEVWTEYIQEPILQIITKPSWSPALNILIVLAYNVMFCLLFAHTIGVGFHNALLWFLNNLRTGKVPDMAKT